MVYQYLQISTLSVLSTVILLTSLVKVSIAQTLPSDLKFKKLRLKKTLTLKRCELISGIKQFQISKKGNALIPPKKQNKKKYRLPEKYKFFACYKTGDVVSLYTKKNSSADVNQFLFTEDDFPDKINDDGGDNNSGSGIGSVCPGGTSTIGFGVLYKPSADASDARQGKPVLLLQGSNKTSSSTLRVYASNGTQICSLGFKSSSIPGVNGGSDHYFSGWSGGCGSTASQMSGAARSASGSSNIYIGWKSGKCLGPVNPTSRMGGIG